MTTIEIRAGGSNPGTLESDADALVGTRRPPRRGDTATPPRRRRRPALGGPGRDAINALAADALSRRRANDDRHAGGKRNGGDGDANDGGDGDANDVVSGFFAGFAACCEVVVAAAGAAGATFFAARGETRRSSTAFPPPSSTAFPPPSSSRASTDPTRRFSASSPSGRRTRMTAAARRRPRTRRPRRIRNFAGVAAVDLGIVDRIARASSPPRRLGRAAIVPGSGSGSRFPRRLWETSLFSSPRTPPSARRCVCTPRCLDRATASLYAPPLHEFSLGSSVRDMRRAGTYPLSILIAVFAEVGRPETRGDALRVVRAPRASTPDASRGVCSRSSTRSASGRSWTRSS